MASNYLATADVLQAFSEEIAFQGGEVTDTFHDGERLFVRSVLPRIDEVKPRDRLQGGVALKACTGEVWIHPYVFRLVCQNGAIMAQAFGSRPVTALVGRDPDEAILGLKEAVRACSVPEAFATSVQQIRSALDIEADFALNLLPLLAHLGGDSSERIARQIMSRFFADGDQSRFGFMNAVTSVARDTADPDVRWNLEELGGGIPVAAPRPTPQKPARKARSRQTALVS